MVFPSLPFKANLHDNLIPMRRKKLPHIIRLIRFTLKCVWFALTVPNDPRYEKKVNFWNMPIRKRQRQYR